MKHSINLEDLSFYDDYDEICEMIDEGTIPNAQLKEYISDLFNLLLDYKYKYEGIQIDYSKLIKNLENSLGLSIINKHLSTPSKPIIFY